MTLERKSSVYFEWKWPFKAKEEDLFQEIFLKLFLKFFLAYTKQSSISEGPFI